VVYRRCSRGKWREWEGSKTVSGRGGFTIDHSGYSESTGDGKALSKNKVQAVQLDQDGQHTAKRDPGPSAM